MAVPSPVVPVSVPVTEFRARCTQLLDGVEHSGEALVITRRGRPVARLVPIRDVAPVTLFGAMRGRVTTQQDLVAPTGEAWEAEA
jgi:prevent-host-death family protein